MKRRYIQGDNFFSELLQKKATHLDRSLINLICNLFAGVEESKAVETFAISHKLSNQTTRFDWRKKKEIKVSFLITG